MLTIDPADPRPPYEQLRTQLVNQIRAGDLVSGTKLPPVRRLASDLGLAPNTVARTYRELEAAGFVRTEGRRGTLVAEPGDPEIHAQAHQLAIDYVDGMRRLGLGQDAIVGYVNRQLAS